MGSRPAPELIAELDAIFATRTRDEWAAVFAAEPALWWAPVQTLDEVVADPQLVPSGALVEVSDARTTTVFPATPVDFHGTPGAQRGMAPEPGRDTDQVLAELGRDAAAIAELRRRGIVA